MSEANTMSTTNTVSEANAMSKTQDEITHINFENSYNTQTKFGECCCGYKGVYIPYELIRKDNRKLCCWCRAYKIGRAIHKNDDKNQQLLLNFIDSIDSLLKSGIYIHAIKDILYYYIDTSNFIGFKDLILSEMRSNPHYFCNLCGFQLQEADREDIYNHIHSEEHIEREKEKKLHYNSYQKD